MHSHDAAGWFVVGFCAALAVFTWALLIRMTVTWSREAREHALEAKLRAEMVSLHESVRELGRKVAELERGFSRLSARSGT